MTRPRQNGRLGMAPSFDGRRPIRKGAPLYIEIRDNLTRRIAEQEWKRDDALPSEEQLADQYGVSVGTVRRSIEQLVDEGLLQRVQGLGTFVRRPNFSSSLLRFLRFRVSEVRESVPQGRVLFKQRAPASEEVASKLDLRQGEPCINIERSRIFDGRAVIAEEIWLPYSKFAPLMQIPNEDFGDLLYPFYEEMCHQIVSRAQETLRVSKASSDARCERDGPTDPIVIVERVAFGLDDAPLEWRVSTCSGSNFSYRIDI